MRRVSVLLAFAAVLLTAVVAYTYKLRVEKTREGRVRPAPRIEKKLEGVAPEGWRYQKDDPQTGKPVVKVDAESAQSTHDPSTFEIHGLKLRLYDKKASSYTFVKSPVALFDERSGVLKSEGAVSILMNVPADKNAEDKAEQQKRVRVETTCVTYETKSGKATTDQAASFVFPDGNGTAVGADYDPNTHALHLRSKVSLNWVGEGPSDRRLHVETQDLVYKELEQKIYLSPWSKLQKQGTTINAKGSIVTLLNGALHQIDSDQAAGSDVRDERRTLYSADKMKASFDDNGDLAQIVGNGNARVTAEQPASRTSISGDRADLRFAIAAQQLTNGKQRDESQLHLVLADGHAIAESLPLPRPGVQLAETRILRSDHIELEMKQGGQEVQEIRAPAKAQLEFKPNRREQSHRLLDASRLRIVYGPSSYVDTFYAWDVTTRTERPAHPARSGTTDKSTSAAQPALTWSNEMVTKFSPNSNEIATIDQSGNFRYQEGPRKASAKRAHLEQTINRITLIDDARVADETGSAVADKIVMNQASGDMDAIGHVISSHEPDRNEKPGTSMLDATQPMQAKAEQMETRESNSKVFYQGHVVMWQGANRISADAINIDRDEQILRASGNVVSELVDNKDSTKKPAQPNETAQTKTTGSGSAPFTIVRAPNLLYRDDTRLALYTGGVKLVREKMTVTSKEIKAYLTPKTDNSNQSSLDHAIADGNVSISEVISPNRTRTGTGQHCEYYTKNDKVVLNGGTPQMIDSYKGITTGQELVYFNGDDHLIVDGQKAALAFTKMKKK